MLKQTIVSASLSIIALSLPSLTNAASICDFGNWQSHSFTKTSGYMSSDCTPEVLYSWGSQAKIERLSSNASSTSIINITSGRGLHSWISPLGSYAYGDRSVRVKLKPGTKFLIGLSNYCEMEMSPEDYNNTVLVYPWNNYGSGVDYVLCSSGPVESWSYGLEDHLLEMILEQDWIKTHGNNIPAYYSEKGKYKYFGMNLDQNYTLPWTDTTMNANITVMKTMVQQNQGKIFSIQKNLSKSEQIKKHFSSSIPLFYNRN